MTKQMDIKDKHGVVVRSFASTAVRGVPNRFPNRAQVLFRSAFESIFLAGCTIEVNGQVYSLLEDYVPVQDGENYLYALEFYTKWYQWMLKPEHFRGTDAVIVNDPSGVYFQYTLRGFMEAIKKGLRDDLNEDFSYQIPETTTRETVHFTTSGVGAALTCISRAWGLKWFDNGSVITINNKIL